MGWTVRGPSPATCFSALPNVQTVPRVHPVRPVNGYRGPFPTVKRPELDAHSPPSSVFMGRAETSGGDTVRSSSVMRTVDGASCNGNAAQPPSLTHSTHLHGIWLDKPYKTASPI